MGNLRNITDKRNRLIGQQILIKGTSQTKQDNRQSALYTLIDVFVPMTQVYFKISFCIAVPH